MMSEPDRAFEQKVLLDVVQQMNDPEATMRKEAGRRKAILGVGTAGVVVAFFLALNGLVHSFVVALVAATAGCVLGFAIFLEFAQRQWPVTRKFIDMDGVRRRLEELQKPAPSNT
jgi:hypothetical protein